VLPSIVPAKLTRSLELFDDKDWLFELKHDGFRSLAYVEDGKVPPGLSPPEIRREGIVEGGLIRN
jgi:hypothetical protein